MGKYYGSGGRQVEQERKSSEPHPVWRGIGFLIILLTPVLGYSAAMLLISENTKQGWFKIPADLIYRGGVDFLPNDPLLYVKAILTLVLMFIIYFLLQLIAMILYRLVAPPRYGVYDVPSVSYKGKKRSR